MVLYTGETVKLVATPNYAGLIPTDTCVLTNTLGTYLSGMSRLNAFLYVEVRANNLYSFSTKQRTLTPCYRNTRKWH